MLCRPDRATTWLCPLPHPEFPSLLRCLQTSSARQDFAIPFSKGQPRARGSLHGQPLESHVFLLACKTQTVLKQRRKGEGGRDVIPKDHGVCRVRTPRGSPDEAPGVRACFGLIFSSVSKEVGQLGSSVLLVSHHASGTSTRKGRLEDAREGRRGAFLQDSLFFPVERHTW